MCHLPTHSKVSFIEAISVHIDDEKNRTVQIENEENQTIKFVLSEIKKISAIFLERFFNQVSHHSYRTAFCCTLFFIPIEFTCTQSFVFIFFPNLGLRWFACEVS